MSPDFCLNFFRFNEEMIESLFGYHNVGKNKNDRKKESSSFEPAVQYIQIIDPKKAQNLAILIRALNVTTEEVIDALEEGELLSICVLDENSMMTEHVIFFACFWRTEISVLLLK